MQVTTNQVLEALSPVDRVLFVTWSLFAGDSKEALQKHFPRTFEPLSLKPAFLQAYLKKLVDFQQQSYFLGIDDSWIEALLKGLPRSPVLLEVLKKKLVRMSQYDDLVKVGKRELSVYLVRVGKQKTARLLAKFPKEIQEAIIAELNRHPGLDPGSSPGPRLEAGVTFPDLEFIFQFNYLNASDLFKQAGLYAKNPVAIQQLAQRLVYAEGQRLIALLTK